MTHQAPTGQRSEAADQPRRETAPSTGFRPVALPALAAAIQAVRPKPPTPRPSAPPAILRKETALD